MVALVFGLLSPGSALAGSDTIFNGWLFDTAGLYGPRHSLSSVWTTQYQGVASCINALNADGSGWAGSTYCTTPSDTNVGHAYCACQLRYGWGAPSSSQGTSAYTRQFW